MKLKKYESGGLFLLIWGEEWKRYCGFEEKSEVVTG